MLPNGGMATNMEGILLSCILIIGNNLLDVMLVIYNVVLFYNRVVTKKLPEWALSWPPTIQNSAYAHAG